MEHLISSATGDNDVAPVFRYQVFIRRETRSATAIQLRREGGYGMAVRFMRWLQCLLCEESTLFRAEIATDAGRVRNTNK